MQELLSSLSLFELFSDCLVAAQDCDLRIAQWNEAKSEEECEHAEQWYYVAQEHWAFFMDEIKRRGKETEYVEFCEFICSKGWQ